jgi:lipoyl synthase
MPAPNSVENHRERLPKPPWIRVRLPAGRSYVQLKEMVRSKNLHTVCEQARCPNMAECWGCGTATFMILGEICTRNCRFCAVKHGLPSNAMDYALEEPERVAQAVDAMKLKHAVITSVTRDDLSDGGATSFAETVRRIRLSSHGCKIEVLIPDFNGDRSALKKVVDSRPEIIGHNIETVPQLYGSARPGAQYRRSLEVLRMVKALDSEIKTKSGIMVGLGETRDELLGVMQDLREVCCDILTIGQYLSPSQSHLPVLRYYPPEEFVALRQAGLEAGFRHVESGPLVRSSYHAEAQALTASSIQDQSPP